MSFVGDCMIPLSFSYLSNLVLLYLSGITLQGFLKNSLSIFSIILSLKIEGEFPSCFQNMTRLTYLHLGKVRGEDTEPIPFPTQFCNMTYLQRFFSRDNNLSGLRNDWVLTTLVISRSNSSRFDKIGQVDIT